MFFPPKSKYDTRALSKIQVVVQRRKNFVPSGHHVRVSTTWVKSPFHGYRLKLK